MKDREYGVSVGQLERTIARADSKRSTSSPRVRQASEDLRGVVGIGAAVPELEGAGDMSFVERDSLP